MGGDFCHNNNIPFEPCVRQVIVFAQSQSRSRLRQDRGINFRDLNDSNEDKNRNTTQFSLKKREKESVP